MTTVRENGSPRTLTNDCSTASNTTPKEGQDPILWLVRMERWDHRVPRPLVTEVTPKKDEAIHG